MEINLTPAHTTNQNECLIFAADIPNKHPFLTRCNCKHARGRGVNCPDLPISFPSLHVTNLALGLLLYSISGSPLSNVVNSLLKWFVY